MPRTLFDQTVVVNSRNRKRTRTLVVSIAAHVAAVAALVAAQLGAIVSPDVARRIDAVLIAAPPPPPPPPPPPSVAPTPARTVVEPINPAAAPIAATEDPVEPAEPPVSTSLSRVGVPGGVPGGTGTEITGITAPPPPQPPAPSGPLPVGGDIIAPERRHHVVPEYPAIARAAKVEGTVILEATIDDTGAVTGVRVLRSIPLLDRAAIDAVAKWRYTPTRLNGKPIAVVMTVTVTFTLR